MTTPQTGPETLQTYIASLPDKKVLVIGDVMLDRFIYGAVNRISPESDAPVLDIRRQTAMPGGAGNVIANLKALGVKAMLLSVTGDDRAGEDLAALLGETGGLLKLAERPTTIKTRFVAAGGQLLRADEESREDIPADTQAQLLAKAEAQIMISDAVVLSDYNKGVLTAGVIGGVIALAKKAGVPVLVDPKKPDYAVYQGADVITPNRKELSEVTGLPAGTDKEVVAAAQKLMAQGGFSQLVVTRSEDGMSVFSAGQEPVHISNEAREVVDVSGAGDTAIAGLAAGLAAGMPLAEAAFFANKAGGLVVGKTGTASVSLAELKGALDEAAAGVQARKGYGATICGWDEAARQIARWREQGLETGFTNGCFDILHYGHVTYLQRARERCDRLIVGLNHDKSVKILKGPERPLNDEQARAAVIGALGVVDMVVFFGAEEEGADNTPCALIEKIQPDVYFKGGDYTIDQLPEAKIMAALGGRTEIMALYDGHSTTAIIEKMKKTEAA